MATTRRFYDVGLVGFTGLQRATKAAGGGFDRKFMTALRRTAAPIAADARSRFQAMPGTGPRTAKTVRASATTKGIGMVLGGRGVKGGGYELGREFGARGPRTTTFQQHRPTGTISVTRIFDYSKPKVFDTFTGTRYSGRAFYPAIRAGADRVVVEAQKVIDGFLERMATEPD